MRGQVAQSARVLTEKRAGPWSSAPRTGSLPSGDGGDSAGEVTAVVLVDPADDRDDEDRETHREEELPDGEADHTDRGRARQDDRPPGPRAKLAQLRVAVVDVCRQTVLGKASSLGLVRPSQVERDHGAHESREEQRHGPDPLDREDELTIRVGEDVPDRIDDPDEGEEAGQEPPEDDIVAHGSADLSCSADGSRHGMFRRLGVVQVEGRTLAADARDRREVVTRRRAGGRPLERSAVAPWIVDRDLGRLPCRDPHVEEERQHRRAENDGADRRDLVLPCPVVVPRVVGVTTRHAVHAQPMLDEEGHMEADEQHPEVDVAQAFVEHASGPLRPPEVEAREHREHHGAEHHIVEVGHHEVGVGQEEVQRRGRQDHTGESAEDERDQEAQREHHRRLEGDRSSPHRADPVEDLHTRRHRDEHGHQGEEGQQDRPRDVHMVRPHRDRERSDRDGRVDEGLVPEDRLAAEHREDLRDDAEERQRDDVDLRVTEEPEQVLPQKHAAVGRVVD
ncbi:hypothetical protein ABE10_02525, partial [Bacillus toyonensis]|nr:hypothetical protein [Bacillus toyonensis]